MLMKVCKECRGAGFRRFKREELHPWQNVASARPIRKPMEPNGDALLAYYQSIVGWEFNCHRCRGQGELQWTRGMSLAPICGSTG